MSDDSPFVPPSITDEDIRWAAGLLGLPDGAFHGESGTDPRQDVLKSMERLDVAACPGSGKTTLLVAKLAILAQKWQDRTRGICVLSHTNAARHEIERLLGHTAVGRRLLNYPHFIGTIHKFVDRFLALPLLRSLGFYSTQFSTEISGQLIWALSNYGAEVPKFLYRKFKDPISRKLAICHVHYVGQDLDLRLEARNTTVMLRRKSGSDTFEIIDRWKSHVLDRGYASYEDTFAYGQDALGIHVELPATLRARFPLLYIDEAQDNREAQSAILHRIFMAGDAPVRRQRFGDANQAIFDANDTTEATKDKFPDDDTPKMDLRNSHRFGPKLARLAGPLGLIQHKGGLIGHCPSRREVSLSQEGAHTVFLFDEHSADKVLDAYGELLIQTFKEELPRGIFTAVGQVHRPPDKLEEHKFPHHIGHYWADYDPELSGQDPKPQTFVQYVFAGQEKAETAGETFPAVEKIAEGILRLAGMTKRRTPFRHRRRSHRFVLQLLEEKTALQGCYKLLVYRLAVRREALTRDAWDDSSRGVVQEIAEGIAGGSLANSEAGVFLAWKDEADSNSPAPTIRRRPDNIYRYSKDGQNVHIRVGSIHSVKGETHTATLVLETFWQGKKGRHNLEHLLPWLTGSKLGADTGVHQNYRLKLHYVAMTRPTHLLCLAINQNSGGESKEKLIDDLKNHGWDVKSVR